MIITGTLVSYYLYCKRRMWLHANEIRMEIFSDTVYEGKLIGETTYQQRSDKYTEIGLSAKWNLIELSCKIDYYDTKNKVVHEIKKSQSHDYTHEWQVKFYLWLLELNGIEGASAILEYPKLRKKDEVYLTEPDKEYLKECVKNIKVLLQNDICPPVINSKICKSCSYYELCYVNETD